MILSDLQGRGTIHGIVRIGGGGGVTDYDDLTNRPKINDITLTGNKTAQDLGLANSSDIKFTGINEAAGWSIYRARNITVGGVIYDVAYPEFTGTDGVDPGTNGLVKCPEATDYGKFLAASGGWENVPTPTETYEVLWDYITDNNNTVKYGSQTYNLHKSIDEYKRIILQMISNNGDPGTTTWNQTNQFPIDMYVLKNGYRPYRTNYTSYDTRTIALYFDTSNDHNILTTHCDDNATNGITYIYGVK